MRIKCMMRNCRDNSNGVCRKTDLLTIGNNGRCLDFYQSSASTMIKEETG